MGPGDVVFLKIFANLEAKSVPSDPIQAQQDFYNLPPSLLNSIDFATLPPNPEKLSLQEDTPHFLRYRF